MTLELPFVVMYKIDKLEKRPYQFLKMIPILSFIIALWFLMKNSSLHQSGSLLSYFYDLSTLHSMLLPFN